MDKTNNKLYEKPLMCFFRIMMDNCGKPPTRKQLQDWIKWKDNNIEEFNEWYMERRQLFLK